MVDLWFMVDDDQNFFLASSALLLKMFLKQWNFKA